MKKYLSMVTLYHLNKVNYIQRGKLHREEDYLFAICIAELNSDLQFKDEQGNIITISNNPDDKYHYDKILVDYDEYKINRKGWDMNKNKYDQFLMGIVGTGIIVLFLMIYVIRYIN